MKSIRQLATDCGHADDPDNRLLSARVRIRPPSKAVARNLTAATRPTRRWPVGLDGGHPPKLKRFRQAPRPRPPDAHPPYQYSHDSVCTIPIFARYAAGEGVSHISTQLLSMTAIAPGASIGKGIAGAEPALLASPIENGEFSPSARYLDLSRRWPMGKHMNKLLMKSAGVALGALSLMLFVNAADAGAAGKKVADSERRTEPSLRPRR